MILHYCLFFFKILVNAFQVFTTNSFLPLLFVSHIASYGPHGNSKMKV